MKKWHRFILYMLLGHICSFSAQAENLRYAVKERVIANILLQLPRYIKGVEPAEPTLCLISDLSFYDTVSALNLNKRAYGSIKRAILHETSGCDYTYADNAADARKLLKRSGRTFTIASYESFVDEGGAIAIVDVQGRVEIQLNLTTASHNNISFSPDLIELSKRVIQ